MSCTGDVCGSHDGGVAIMPGPDFQSNVARGAALDASERTMRMTQVLAVGAPPAKLGSRVIVPASLRRVSAAGADPIDGAGFVVRDE